MINAKGEVIYSSAEVGYELGLTAATINAVGRRLYGHGKIPHWTLHEAQRIAEYIKSISVEEDAKRLADLHNTIKEVFGGQVLDETDTRKRIEKDTYLKRED